MLRYMLARRIMVPARYMADIISCLQNSLSWASFYHFNSTLNGHKSLCMTDRQLSLGRLVQKTEAQLKPAATNM